MKRSGIITLAIIAVIILAPQLSVEAKNPSIDEKFMPLSEGLIQDVPYVWQEINGLCAWAATSVAVQAAGVDLDLHDVLAATSVGLSFAYVRYNDTWLMYPGAIYMQAEPTQFLADLYGLNLTMYFDALGRSVVRSLGGARNQHHSTQWAKRCSRAYEVNHR
ncbi:MAG: hypothetical protein ACW974_13570 [Candidatus Thorarchaeota archaeon]|jgi:hypothetical protein